MQNGLYPAPGTAVQVTPQQPVNLQQHARTVTKTQSVPAAVQNQVPSRQSTTEVDVDCLQRFLKVKVYTEFP